MLVFELGSVPKTVLALKFTLFTREYFSTTIKVVLFIEILLCEH